jgi:hypothetical protein
MNGEAQMLRLIESLNEKVDAYEKLEARLKEVRRNTETRVVVWRPDSREMTIYHNGTYWFGSIPPNEKDATPRYWNPFGEYRETGNLQIAVEINVPTKLNERRVSGFFARESSPSREVFGNTRRSERSGGHLRSRFSCRTAKP